MRVELIYDADCPNVAAARAIVRQAFAEAHVEAEWTEWERSSPLSPDYVARFGSPTILVDGYDIAGAEQDEFTSCCRLYGSVDGRYSGVPPVHLLKTLLASATPRTLTGDQRPELFQ